MWLLKKIFFQTFLEVRQCGSTEDNNHIVNRPPDKNNWPWMASLGLLDKYGGFELWRHLCGATLITSKFLLSAAHCVVGDNGYFLIAEIARYRK
jgi:secreted trypsin-like serine protease